MRLSVKKTSAFVLLAGSSLAMAGAMGPIESSEGHHDFYIEGAAGGAFSQWRPALNYIFPGQTNVQLTHVDGGFAGGGDLGYKLNRYFSLEAGALSLPRVTYTIQSAQSTTTSYTATDTGTISNWLIDFSGKVAFPIAPLPGLDVFGKLGIAYRAGNYVDNETLNGDINPLVPPSVFNIIEPIVGGGLQYHLNERWVINAQYLFVPYGILSTTILGPTQADHGSIPSAQMVTGGIGFYF